jgi:hypothetical protein
MKIRDKGERGTQPAAAAAAGAGAAMAEGDYSV